MPGIRVQIVGTADFTDLAEVHHHDTIADIFDDGKIVRDEDQRQAIPGLHIFEQVEDLGLHRNVKR